MFAIASIAPRQGMDIVHVAGVFPVLLLGGLVVADSAYMEVHFIYVVGGRRMDIL